MRVLTVSSARFGVKHVVYNLLGELSTRDIDIDTITLPIHDLPAGVGRETLLDATYLERLKSVQPLYLAYGIFGFWWRAYKYVAEYGSEYDVIWLHNPRLLPMLPKIYEENVVITLHNHVQSEKVSHHGFPASVYYRLVGLVEERGIERFSNATFTVVYEEIRRELIDRGVPSSNVQYVGNGVDLDRFSPEEPYSNEQEDQDDASLTLLYLGRLTEQKRPTALVDIFEELLKIDGDPSLVVAGAGPESDEVERKMDKIPTENAQFLGFVAEDDKPDIYRDADLFVLPSKYEGEPLALYEALASGLPCIVSEIPNLRFVPEENCGIAINPEQTSESAARIRRYMDDKQQRAKNSYNARNYAEKELSWNARANEYMKILRRTAL